MDWFATHTRWNEEHEARRNLEAQGFVVYLPLTRLPRNANGVRRPVPLFPSYLFIRQSRDWSRANGTRGVIRVLTCGDDPSPIHGRIIDALRTMEDELGYIAAPECDSSTRFRRGDRVWMKTTGLTGEFVSWSGRARCTVLFSLLGRTVQADIPSAALRKAA